MHRENPRITSGTSCQVTVKYGYVLDGVRYTGDTLAIGYGGSRDREAQQATRRRVLKMKRFVVRHHPGKPEMSTIFASENAFVFGLAAVALIWWMGTFVATAIVLAVSGLGSAMLGWFNEAV